MYGRCEIKTKKIPFYKFYKPKFDKFILDGGWHFSSVKNAEGIYKKLNSYAEQQFNKIVKKEDLFDRNYDFKVLEIDKTFPDYIFRNKKELFDFIYK